MNFDESHSDQSDSNESQTTKALVPMVDLFAVRAIVFMIYSNAEIEITKQEAEDHINEIVATSEKEVERIDKESEATLQLAVMEIAEPRDARIREL